MTGRRRVTGAGISALIALITALGALGTAAPAATANTTEFPDGYAGYHTYAEMEATIDAAVAAHPQIIRKFSIGQSSEGREIWAVKISDRVALDEAEPEVLFESLHHAREHLTVEMALYLMELLTGKYDETDALGQRVTQVVDTREIFIVPMVNPDGAEYDISGGTLRRWRRNRQPIADTSSVGVDLNRNWGFKWGCCGGSSGTPGKLLYRGPTRWFAPEVVALRDFVEGRVQGGRQQITSAISWHTYGELVMWPYGYTRTNLPRTMTADDLAALQAIGRGMAGLNGYMAQQMSDLYVLDGASSDWLYHEQRIMAFTVELYPPDPSNLGGFYPTDAVIAAETERNTDAALYFLEQADCPYRAAGLLANCGPLYDDYEIDRGWTVNPLGTDTATSGAWQRDIPQRTKTNTGIKQRAVVPSGESAFVTGALAGANAPANDVDGGVTSLRSQPFVLGSPTDTGWTLAFSYSFAHNAKARAVDFLSVSVDGQPTPLFIQRGRSDKRNAVWTSATVDLDAYAGQAIRLLIKAADAGPDSLIEAAIDDFRVYHAPSE